MRNQQEISRRKFLGALGAGAVAGTVGPPQRLQGASGGWTPPPVLKNPNILIIMVDQMRLPVWLSESQSDALGQTILPNIIGQIQANSYNFSQYYVAATACTASRATLLTGLYAPQTAMYATSDAVPGAPQPPALNTAFPTWASIMALLNPAYMGNIWWFGKWHLSDALSAAPLLPYGFNTRTYPGGTAPPYNHSPNGAANEGTDGGPFKGVVFASDAMITTDFLGWLQGQSPFQTPWCATVSLINPHDINAAPGWLQSNPFPPPGLPVPAVYYPPPPGNPPQFYQSLPSPWNYEDLQQAPNKPSLQPAFQTASNNRFGVVTSWITFLNQYYWLQNFVDQQIGLILEALYASAFGSNTVIIFTSDHGEYAGSHGLHAKGYGVYDESIRVPLYIQFPGQTGSVAMNHMCSSVDIFGLLCDLASAGSGIWRLACPDLGNRQSLWSFLYKNGSETRMMPGPAGIPYVLHTFDEPGNNGTIKQNSGNSHILCIRGKLDLNEGAVGAKLASYSQWNPCTTYPGPSAPEWEFYDYNPATSNNTSELGNDYYSNNATTQATIAKYTQALGSLGPTPSGISGSEVNAPLIGTGADGKPLSRAQAAARQAYFSYVNGSSTCLS